MSNEARSTEPGSTIWETICITASQKADVNDEFRLWKPGTERANFVDMHGKKLEDKFLRWKCIGCSNSGTMNITRVKEHLLKDHQRRISNSAISEIVPDEVARKRELFANAVTAIKTESEMKRKKTETHESRKAHVNGIASKLGTPSKIIPILT